MLCNEVRWRFTDAAQTFGVLAVGPECAVGVQRTAGKLVGTPGDECIVRVGGNVHRLRVTDAQATFALRSMVGRYGVITWADPSAAGVRIGGDERDGTGRYRHVILDFDGRLVREGDAHDMCVDALRPDRTAMDPARSGAPEAEIFEANGFP